MSYLKTFLPYLFGNKRGMSYKLPPSLDWGSLSFEETLMFHSLQNSLNTFLETLSLSELNSSQIFHLLSFKEYLPEDFMIKFKEKFKDEYQTLNLALAKKVLNTESVQEILNYQNHELTVFALLNPDRTIPGRLFIRSKKGHFIHDKKGQVWSIKVLATSGRGLAFNHTNGSTPAGIYSIDSVMPEANKNLEFGKFRRLIVNFLPKSANEENIKQFLPKNQHQDPWWTPCIVGRELGRSLLRIHGTGTLNKNPFSPYFPMIPSSGCLTTTERSFMGLVSITDQRHLLDTLMTAQGLAPSYENESKIHGVLYVIEFDGTYQALEFKS